MKKTEILSPAGSFESLVAAVRAGADAVYLGMREMSARRNAENFDLNGLKEAVSYCRKCSVKVYLTLNIMLKQHELSEAVELVKSAAECGVSGVIVQDLGLAAMLHEIFPTLPLHASTQLSVNSPAALSTLKEMGFCRVVTAREMSREELRVFCKEAERLDMEVEVFVHGALCMSVSGQCLMSALLGGRSGNRGLCAGPCRLPFEAENGTGYDLSLKDLSLLPYLNELAEMGVTSFKIEGRMKRPEYVAASTAAARLSLDGVTEHELFDTLKNVFSRSGFTDGYYTKNLGREMFGIRTREDVVAAGDAIPKLHELYRNERQSVPISAKFKAVLGKRVVLCLCDGENSVEIIATEPSVAAKRPLDSETVKNYISKLGSTPYFLKELCCEIGENVFLSASELNDIRRKAVEELSRVRCVSPIVEMRPLESGVSDIEHNETPRLVARFSDAKHIPDDLNGVSAVVLPLFSEGIENVSCSAELIAELPRRIRDEKIILKKLKELKGKGLRTALCGNLSAVMLAKAAGMNVVGDVGLNVLNNRSCEALNRLNVSAVTLSAEIDMIEAVRMPTPIYKGVFAYGRLPLMLLENCPLKNGRSCFECDKRGYVTDRKGINFPVRCSAGVSELLNHLPIWLADRTREMIGLDYLYLRFDDETPQEARTVIDAYINHKPPIFEHTRGLYFRQVL